MGRLPKDLEEKRLRLESAARRGAFESYVRHGRVPEVYARIAEVVDEAKNLGDSTMLPMPDVTKLPAGRPTNHYTWRTAGDDRVRGSHAARDDRVFSWPIRRSMVTPATSRTAAAGPSRITATQPCRMRCWRWCPNGRSI